MRVIRPATWTCAAVMLLSAAFAHGQLAQEFHPPKADCCLQFAAQSLADQLQDWNQLGRYHADDVRLMAQSDPQRVVFFGDALTDEWKLEQFFPGKPYVNRGIAGQTTQQLLVRIFPDVIRLHPAAVIILAGTNDIAGNTGAQTAEMIGDNLRALTELAERHSIKVVLCSITPINDYTGRKQSDHRPPADILKLNGWLKRYAQEERAVYADYHAVLQDAQGFLKHEYSPDGTHMNELAYAAMAKVAEAAIQQALKK